MKSTTLKKIINNSIYTLTLLIAATALGFVIFYVSKNNTANIALVYILALLMISRHTASYACGIFSAVFSVVSINCFFTYPFFAVNFTLDGYPITFIFMLAIAVLTSATTIRMKKQEKMIAERERRINETEKERIRANLLRAVSHDLRTPLTSIIGATVIGVGCGIVVRNQATTGGSDIVAMILQKYCHIKFSSAILLVDAMVVGFGLVVIGFGIGNPEEVSGPSWHLSFYSLIAIYVTSRVIAYVINGSKDDKLIFVISDQEMAGLHQFILKELDRTATRIKSSGLYSGQEKEMLFLVVSHKEVASIKHVIRENDPRAFVVVTDAYDTFGEGWKPLPTSGEIQPE